MRLSGSVFLPLLASSVVVVSSEGCGLTIGRGRGNGNGQGNGNNGLAIGHEKRPVELGNLPKACDKSDFITVTNEVTGKSKQFQKKRVSKPGLSGKKVKYWYGEDPADGSAFNYIRVPGDRIFGSLVDLTENTVSQFSVDADGQMVVTTTASQDFPPEADTSQDDGRLLTVSSPPFTILQGNQDRELETGDTVLDVLVVWTKNAECSNSGVSHTMKRQGKYRDYVLTLTAILVSKAFQWMHSNHYDGSKHAKPY
jgi:hypothetical protein